MIASKVHKKWRISDIERLIIPPLELDQYFAFDRGGQIVGFFSWADLTAEAEAGFLARTRPLQAADWNGGDGTRIWAIDALAPYGGVLGMVRTVRQEMRQMAKDHEWPATRIKWARCFGTGQVQKIGSAR